LAHKDTRKYRQLNIFLKCVVVGEPFKNTDILQHWEKVGIKEMAADIEDNDGFIPVSKLERARENRIKLLAEKK